MKTEIKLSKSMRVFSPQAGEWGKGKGWQDADADIGWPDEASPSAAQVAGHKGKGKGDRRESGYGI